MAWATLDEWWREVGEAELRLILWAAWDPIGYVPRDEYDLYLPKLWELLIEHALTLGISDERYEELSETERDDHQDRVIASQRRIEAQLSEWRTGEMGLGPDPQTDAMVARKLTDWLRPASGSEFAPSDLPV